jgi:chitinase
MDLGPYPLFTNLIHSFYSQRNCTMWSFSFFTLFFILIFGGATHAESDAASPINPCPVRCSKSGLDPLKWTYLHGVVALNRCKKPMLFSTMLNIPVDAPDKHITIRACTDSEDDTTQAPDYDPVPFTFGVPKKRSEQSQSIGCPSDMARKSNQTSIYYHEWHTNPVSMDSTASDEDAAAALGTLKSYFTKTGNCQHATMFAKVGSATVGAFVGYAVDRDGFNLVLERFISTIQSSANVETNRFTVQSYKETHSSSLGFGIVADLQNNITAAQESIASWSQGKSPSGADATFEWSDFDIKYWLMRGLNSSSVNATINATTNHSSNATLSPKLHQRATCSYQEVFKDDDCNVLAQRCGISLTRFYGFNPGLSNTCKIKPKQFYCCSAGDAPDCKWSPYLTL